MLVDDSRRLLFVSTRFLFPADSGGKIRTGQVLRGLKGGRFHITLAMPCSAAERDRFAADIAGICDELVYWEPPQRGTLAAKLQRVTSLFGRYPVAVASDRSAAGSAVVRAALEAKPDVVVFDFPHSVILAPERIEVPSVMFTHNVEAEIFQRHAEVASSGLMRAVWRSQHRKMLRFEREVLERFDAVVAVSEKDCEYFRDNWSIDGCRPIPTGVDTEFFVYQQPASDRQVVFCGSMDWIANIDAMEFFHSEVWPEVRKLVPDACMKVVGKAPPDEFARRVNNASPEWQFTGFVDDVREHVGGSGVFVIPLRVGSGTRIKAFEAMAMGCPVVSTSIGIEGLDVTDGEHYLNADEPAELAAAIARLLENAALRDSMSQAARSLVEARFGYRRAAAVFEDICTGAMQ